MKKKVTLYELVIRCGAEPEVVLRFTSKEMLIKFLNSVTAVAVSSIPEEGVTVQ